MSEYPYLAKNSWTRPESYYGHNPVGDYVIYSRHRDSSILENCNYDIILDTLNNIKQSLHKDDSYVYDFRASRWAVGWIAYITLEKDSPKILLDKAEKILYNLDCYPISNEEKYSELQHDAIYEHWDNMSLAEKIEEAKAKNLSIFLIRKSMPDEIFDFFLDLFY